MFRKLFLPTKYTYIKQKVTILVYDVTNYTITGLIFRDI